MTEQKKSENGKWTLYDWARQNEINFNQDDPRWNEDYQVKMGYVISEDHPLYNDFLRKAKPVLDNVKGDLFGILRICIFSAPGEFEKNKKTWEKKKDKLEETVICLKKIIKGLGKPETLDKGWTFAGFLEPGKKISETNEGLYPHKETFWRSTLPPPLTSPFEPGIEKFLEETNLLIDYLKYHLKLNKKPSHRPRASMNEKYFISAMARLMKQNSGNFNDEFCFDLYKLIFWNEAQNSSGNDYLDAYIKKRQRLTNRKTS